jgi:hypothetical protein
MRCIGLKAFGQTYQFVFFHQAAESRVQSLVPQKTLKASSIIDDVLGPVTIGRDPRDAMVIQEDLYDMMRVRGFFGGYYMDAIAGVDIAIWDLFGKLEKKPFLELNKIDFTNLPESSITISIDTVENQIKKIEMQYMTPRSNEFEVMIPEDIVVIDIGHQPQLTLPNGQPIPQPTVAASGGSRMTMQGGRLRLRR